MPIPNQVYANHLGIPAATGSNATVLPIYQPNLLQSGTSIVFIDAAGVRHQALMGHVRSDLSPVQISVRWGGVEYTNVVYNDTPATNPPLTWRFPGE